MEMAILTQTKEQQEEAVRSHQAVLIEEMDRGKSRRRRYAAQSGRDEGKGEAGNAHDGRCLRCGCVGEREKQDAETDGFSDKLV